MTEKDFNEILDFAVEREKESVRFYRDLQQEAKFKDQIDMLKDLEAMEMGHIKVIEGISQLPEYPHQSHETRGNLLQAVFRDGH